MSYDSKAVRRGNAIREEEPDSPEPCEACGGGRHIDCPTCANGPGDLCGACEGSGTVPCPDCAEDDSGQDEDDYRADRAKDDDAEADYQT